jgi:hypothetical protein
MAKYTQTTQTPWTQSVDQLTQTISTILDAQNQRKKQESADARQAKIDEKNDAIANLKAAQEWGDGKMYDEAVAQFNKVMGTNHPKSQPNAVKDYQSTIGTTTPDATVPVDPAEGFAPGAERLTPESGTVKQFDPSQFIQAAIAQKIPPQIAYQMMMGELEKQKQSVPKTQKTQGTTWSAIKIGGKTMWQQYRVPEEMGGAPLPMGEPITQEEYARTRAGGGGVAESRLAFDKEKDMQNRFTKLAEMRTSFAKAKAGGLDMLKDYGPDGQERIVGLGEYKAAIDHQEKYLKSKYPKEYGVWNTSMQEPPAQTQNSMPDPVSNKGKFMTDTATKTRFQSNGVMWVPVK